MSIFKRHISIFLLGLFLFSILRPVLPYLEYHINYQYIVENLCVNRDKPEMQCNGRCHLNKELAKSNTTKGSKQKSIPKIDFEKFVVLSVKEGDLQMINPVGRACSAFAKALTTQRPLQPPTPPPQC